MPRIKCKQSYLFLLAFFIMLSLYEVNVYAAEGSSHYVTVDRVNLRSEPSLDANILVTVNTGSSIIVENLEDGWYKIVYNGTQGYMKSEYVGVSNVSGDDKVSDDYVTIDTVNLRTEPSLDANILTTVSPGSSILAENLENGWHKVVYNETQGYMKSEYVGNPDDWNQSRSAELIEWSEAKANFLVGVPAEIHDVRTGLRYYVKSFSNGNHADVEPITKEDTATMFKTFNGNWSWDTRPILVTINGRTMAASVSGMPHGGGINSDNGVDGQFCIHFKGSTTHNGNKSHEADHQNAVIEAYNKSK